ncbi:alpha/beta hydrolase [Nonomuraea sp. NBC_01738]|uniref:alpha/beta fold hydrolase n=1 Tax=Nonomuraea sp. NBC_01738 TaxID=2976003 RepID=UPI002E11CCC1|nr:alpha/beta hydrolase [Nonomuraea sp. NBC_01738]
MTIWNEAAGSGRPVVLLHSGVCDSRQWDPQWDELAGRFRVIRVDYRGFGRTPYTADGPFSQADDVAEVMREHGAERAVLVASSYGCRVALQLAGMGLAGKLVLLNPGSDLPKSDDMRECGAQEDRLLEAGDIDGAAELNARFWLGPEAGEPTRALVTEMQAQAFRLQLGVTGLDEYEPEFDLAKVTVPALVVVGAHDAPHFRDSAPHLAGQLPEARHVELDWAGHLPNLERPQEITRLLLDYI